MLILFNIYILQNLFLINKHKNIINIPWSNQVLIELSLMHLPLQNDIVVILKMQMIDYYIRNNFVDLV